MLQVWSLAEGRCPWSGTLQLPEVQLQEFDSGVWALTAMAGSSSGGMAGPCTVVTGTEEGMLQAWDLRARGGGGGSFGTAAWQVGPAGTLVVCDSASHILPCAALPCALQHMHVPTAQH